MTSCLFRKPEQKVPERAQSQAFEVQKDRSSAPLLGIIPVDSDSGADPQQESLSNWPTHKPRHGRFPELLPSQESNALAANLRMYRNNPHFLPSGRGWGFLFGEGAAQAFPLQGYIGANFLLGNCGQLL